ncbi:hypothetical protein MTO96_036492 [Rhipicephalus appendiculatus]
MLPPKEHFFNVRTPPGTSVDEVIDAMETLVGLQEIYSVQHHEGFDFQELESISSNMRRLALAAEESTALLRRSAEAVERAPSAQEACLRESETGGPVHAGDIPSEGNVKE